MAVRDGGSADAHDAPPDTTRLQDRCPGCGLSWWLFPPVRIWREEHRARCIECKRVYEVPEDAGVRAG